MKISVIIPVYNERDTILEILDRVEQTDVAIDQVVVVDDGSTDGTVDLVRSRNSDSRFVFVAHDENRGKGAAVATGLDLAAGLFVVIQDADLEYDPNDLPELLAPLLNDQADVVFGSRFVGGKESHIAYHHQRWGNRLVTVVSNLFSGLRLTDMECCYKAFRRDLVADMTIEERGFGFEAEITAKLAKRRPRFHEVAVSYHARTVAEGKKITLLDGLYAIYAIMKYNLLPERKRGPEPCAAESVH